MLKWKILFSLLLATSCITTITSYAFYYQGFDGVVHKDLSETVIFLDAGHGGMDNGASEEPIVEDEINLSIVNYLYDYLFDAGAMVYVTRTADYDLASLYAKNRKHEDLQKRVKRINEANPDLFISIHLNTYPSSRVNGAQVFYKYNSPISKKFAESIQTRIQTVTHYKKTTKLGDYYILNRILVPGVIVECGFITGYEDQKRLIQESYQSSIAHQIYLGVLDCFSPT